MSKMYQDQIVLPYTVHCSTAHMTETRPNLTKNVYNLMWWIPKSANPTQIQVGLGDTRNFNNDKYREKISRYSIYRDTIF